MKLSDFEIKDYSALVAAAAEEQIRKALRSCGQRAETHAKDLCPVNEGHLKRSITHVINDQEKSVLIGSNMKYAPYVELGTGKYYNNGSGGRQTSWTYADRHGVHMTHGQKAQPFLRPAVAEHSEEYKQLILQALQS